MTTRFATTDSLVPLEVGSDAPALYCSHAIGGTVRFFSPVARRLAGVRNVYGLLCHGLSPGNEPDRTIEEMAARYVNAITTVQPDGPYDIVGYSLGGLIAFEMACLLTEQGREVRLVGLLDGVPPGFPTSTIDINQTLGLVSRAVGLMPPFSGDPGKPESQLLDEFLAEAVARRVLPAAFRVTDLRRMVDIYAVNGQAGNNYRPSRRFPGDLHFLCTRPDLLPEVVEQWGQYADGKVFLTELAADHFALMHEQHAAQVVEVLTGWLDGLPRVPS